jgi:hypothetical protein
MRLRGAGFTQFIETKGRTGYPLAGIALSSFRNLVLPWGILLLALTNLTAEPEASASVVSKG